MRVLLGAAVLCIVASAAQAAVIGKATVTAEQAPVMQGKDVVLTAKKGDTFEVSEVKGDWYGVAPSRGWIHKANVRFEPAAFPVGDQTIAPASGTKEPAWAVIILKSGLVPKEVRWPEAPKGTGKFLTEEVSPTPISAIVKLVGPADKVIKGAPLAGVPLDQYHYGPLQLIANPHTGKVVFLCAPTAWAQEGLRAIAEKAMAAGADASTVGKPASTRSTSSAHPASLPRPRFVTCLYPHLPGM
jgi:hypothetical protein